MQISRQLRARFLSHTQSTLRLWSANHRPGYWRNLPCDWPSTAWAYSGHETENRLSCHDWPDWNLYVRAKLIFTRFELWAHYPLVQWAPAYSVLGWKRLEKTFQFYANMPHFQVKLYAVSTGRCRLETWIKQPSIRCTRKENCEKSISTKDAFGFTRWL